MNTFEVRLMHNEAIFSCSGDGFRIHQVFFDFDYSKMFDIVVKSNIGEIIIYFNKAPLFYINDNGVSISPNIYNQEVIKTLKIFKDGVYLNEPWLIIGVYEDGTNYFLCQQSEDCNSWEFDFDHEAIAFFSQDEVEMELRRQQESDMDWFIGIEAHPISYFAS